MTYDEAMDTTTVVSRDEARREIEAHGNTMEQFLLEHKDAPQYRAAAVLAWLGY